MVAFNCPAVPPAPSPADRAAIRGVIESQLEAFQQDDADLAFSFAAPGIRTRFGTPARFLRMVTEHYMAVYRPRRIRFGDLITHGAEPMQKVHVVGPDGESVLALYLMQRQSDGQWRINGCMLLDDDSTCG